MSGFRVSESRLCLLKKISERSKRHRVRLRRLAAGACDGTRTCDLRITNALHYQLCYTSILCFIFATCAFWSEISHTAAAFALHCSIFLPFADSLHLPPAAVVCSAQYITNYTSESADCQGKFLHVTDDPDTPDTRCTRNRIPILSM